MFSGFDWQLLLPAALLVSIGSLVLSSVAPAAYPVQFLYILLAFVAFLVCSRLDFHFYKALAPAFYIFSLVLLLATLFFGSFSRGSVRWIEVGVFTLQTSEVIKPFVILFIARIIASSDSFQRFIFGAVVGAVPFILVFVQPDLGSSLVIAIGVLGVLFFGGIPWKAVAVSFFLFVLGLPILWHLLDVYQKERLFTFVQPTADPLGAGYNSIQAIIAIGSGGFLGRGLGQGTQSQLLFLPERHTDFIFASIGEELGFLGAGLIVIFFVMLLVRLAYLFIWAKNDFAHAFFGGVFLLFFAQAAINIGMNLGLLPITGIPLPFVSSGGSSLLSMSATLGIVSSCTRSLRSGSV